MSAAKYNMVVNQGEDFVMQITIKDQSGVPVSLVGSTFEGQLRSKYDSNVVAASFSFELGSDPGTLLVKMSNAVTAAIPTEAATTANKRPLTEFIYDIEQTKAGVKTRILEGIVSVSPNVTR